jgi:hypothetical protein
MRIKLYALLLWYENSHDHVADLIQKMDDAAPGDETHIAAQILYSFGGLPPKARNPLMSCPILR